MRRVLNFITCCFNYGCSLQGVEVGHDSPEGESKPLITTADGGLLAQDQTGAGIIHRPPSPPVLGKTISILTLNGSSVISMAANELDPLEHILQKWCEIHKPADYNISIILKEKEYFGSTCKPVLTLTELSSSSLGFKVSSARFTAEGIKQLELKAQDVGVISVSLKNRSSLFSP